MQFAPISIEALASVLLLSSFAVAFPTAATKEGSVTLPGGVVHITSVLSANGTETCDPLECSCEDKAAGVIRCVVPLGGDKTKCTNMCLGINRNT
ncbi:uncharacterized protein PG998_003741 [Apiospora kogelbergensis]|uniref:Uncharacterized protein n=1 Tax=Apiospora kogelbergensis TaxID=1337665 RepID=A0AAW0QJT3_9PEZI